MDLFAFTRALVDLDSTTGHERRWRTISSRIFRRWPRATTPGWSASPPRRSRQSLRLLWRARRHPLHAQWTRSRRFFPSREDATHITAAARVTPRASSPPMVAAAESLLAGGTRNFAAVVCRRRGAQQHWRQNRRRLLHAVRASSSMASPRKIACPWVQRRSSLRNLPPRGSWLIPPIRSWATPPFMHCSTLCGDIRAIALPSDPLLAKPLNVGTLSGGRAPNCCRRRGPRRIMFRLVGEPSASVRKWLARHPCTTSRQREVLYFPAVRMAPLDGLPTTVVGLHYRHSSFDGTWGQPFSSALQHSRGAHRARSGIPKTELTAAVEIYARMVRQLLTTEPHPHEHAPRNCRHPAKWAAWLEQLLPTMAFEGGARRFDVRTLPTLSRESAERRRDRHRIHHSGWPRLKPSPPRCVASRSVCGTTGWYDHLPQVRNAVVALDTALVLRPNFLHRP